jgi:hypothetical protein
MNASASTKTTTQLDTRVRDYRESDFQTDFGKYVRHMLRGVNASFELKCSKTAYINYHRLRERDDHQPECLKASKGDGLYFKIPDDSQGAKPFDCFNLAGAKAYVVVMFRSSQIGQKEFVMIDIDDWENEEAKGDASLTEGRAKEVGIICELK